MWAFLVVVYGPILQLFLHDCKALEPVCVQTFYPEATVEGFDERIVGGLRGQLKSSVKLFEDATSP